MIRGWKNCASRLPVSGLVGLLLLTSACGLNGDLYLPDDEPGVDGATLPLPEQTEDEGDSATRESGSVPPY